MYISTTELNTFVIVKGPVSNGKGRQGKYVVEGGEQKGMGKNKRM